MARPASSIARCLALALALAAAMLPPLPQAQAAVDQGAPAVSRPGSAADTGRDTKANYALEIDAPDELAKLLKANSLLGRWQYRDDYDPSQRPLFVRRAPEEARQVLSTEGYFEPELEITESEYKVQVKVWAGPRTTVNGVTITFEGAILEDRFARRRTQINADWPLGAGAFFNQANWDRAKRQLLDSLRNEGFPRAQISDSRAAVDLQKSAVALSVTVDSGPLMYFGELSFSGLERYDKSTVAPLAAFERGGVYSLQKLLEFQSRLRETLFFNAVTVLPDLASLEEQASPSPGATGVPGNRREVDIHVAVTEAKSERLTLGVGYSTDRGVRGQIGWTDRNFRSRAWLLDAKLVVDQLSQQANVLLRTPLDATRHYYQTGARIERNDIQNTAQEIGSVHIGRGKRENDIEYFASLTYQMDREKVFDGSTQVSRSNQRALVPGYSWNIRRLDSRLYPTRGYTFNAQVSGATEELLADNTFGRGYVRTVRFLSVPRGNPLGGGMLVLIGEAGAVIADSSDGIPSENLFRAGGSQSVRGYGYQSLGVRQGDAVVGGRYLLAGTIEYQHPLVRDFAGAIFYDRGGVGDKWHEFKTVAGYGVGLRWRTPVGPVNFDIAYGQAVERFRFHFSIGYTF